MNLPPQIAALLQHCLDDREDTDRRFPLCDALDEHGYPYLAKRIRLEHGNLPYLERYHSLDEAEKSAAYYDGVLQEA